MNGLRCYLHVLASSENDRRAAQAKRRAGRTTCPRDYPRCELARKGDGITFLPVFAVFATSADGSA
ncbi:hypothetical protein [Thauera butanivorans]|uniref:hypothetical protein n=1 Tax=Thauera butanivorans TaxID=86174 RepID=UPI0012F939D1|nr:hypothetical protein [Thauera butanivorans]